MSGWLIEHEVTGSGRSRVGTWRGGSAGTVLFLPGRGDSLELREPVARSLAGRGLSTVLVEHVGQGGSGHLGRHPQAVHIDDFDEHLGVARRVARRLAGESAPGPLFLLAHSMGGLIALPLLAEADVRFTAALLTAPMWRFAEGVPLPALQTVAYAMARLGRARTFAWGEGPWSLDRCLDMRTTDPAHRRGLTAFAGAAAHRDLLRGGSTWGWVGAASRLMTRLPRLPLGSVTIPVTVVTARGDTTVANRATARLTARLPRGRLVTVPGGHDVLNESAATQHLLWTELETTFGP